MISEFENPNGNGSTPTKEPLPEFKSVQKVGSIPVVHDGLTTLEHYINSTQFTSSLYSTASGVALKSYEIATPLLVRTKPLWEQADGLVVGVLDYVESKYPYPFQAPTNEIIDKAKQPAYQVVASAHGVYDKRIAPAINTEMMQRIISSIYEINKSLAGVAVAVKDRIVFTGHTAIEQAQSLSTMLVDQLHQLQSHGKEHLPANMSENINEAYKHVTGIMAEKDKSAQAKATEIGQYVQSIVQPEIQKVQEYVFKAKDDAATKASETTEQAEQAVEEHTQ